MDRVWGRPEKTDIEGWISGFAVEDVEGWRDKGWEVEVDLAMGVGFEQQHTVLLAEGLDSSIAVRQQHVPFGPQDEG
jgi:hypothetical protein